MNPTDREIVRTIARLDGPVSQQEIAVQSGCSRVTVARALIRLNGIVSSSGASGRTPHTYQINYAALPEPLKSELTPHG